MGRWDSWLRGCEREGGDSAFRCRWGCSIYWTSECVFYWPRGEGRDQEGSWKDKRFQSSKMEDILSSGRCSRLTPGKPRTTELMVVLLLTSCVPCLSTEIVIFILLKTPPNPPGSYTPRKSSTTSGYIRSHSPVTQATSRWVSSKYSKRTEINPTFRTLSYKKNMSHRRSQKTNNRGFNLFFAVAVSML